MTPHAAVGLFQQQIPAANRGQIYIHIHRLGQKKTENNSYASQKIVLSISLHTLYT